MPVISSQPPMTSLFCRQAISSRDKCQQGSEFFSFTFGVQVKTKPQSLSPASDGVFPTPADLRWEGLHF